VETQAVGVLHGALVTAGLLAAPVLGAALLVGLVVGLLQAVTQLQDVTVGFVPKLAAVGVVVWWLGPWALHVLVAFAQTAWGQAAHPGG